MKLVLYKLDQLVYYILEINIIYMIKEIIMIVILIMKEQNHINHNMMLILLFQCSQIITKIHLAFKIYNFKYSNNFINIQIVILDQLDLYLNNQKIIQYFIIANHSLTYKLNILQIQQLKVHIIQDLFQYKIIKYKKLLSLIVLLK